ncbi:MAG: 5,10-methylenetetrahydrofolate reductase, partial [uncultured Solirubrobacteraceae bacterium]
ADRRGHRAQRPAGVLLRVLPAQDPGGRGEPRGGPRRARAARADLRLGHLRGGRDDRREAQDGRDRLAHQGAVRPRGDGPLHVRRGDGRRAALDARPHGRGRRRQRARAARRPAARRGGVDGRRGRALLLARARGAHPRRVRLLHRRRGLPGDPRPRRVAGGRPPLPQGEGRSGRRLPRHPALLRQRGLLRLRRAGPRGRHRRADHPGHLAHHELQADRADLEAHRLEAARGAARRARGAGRPARGGHRVRRRLRDAPVRRPAGQGRAGHPPLHAQPLARDPGDHVRAAGHGAVAWRRARV